MPKSVQYFESIDSTNLEAKRQIKTSGLRDSYIIAGTQTSGHGRFERAWYSPAGKGIYLTAVFNPIQEIDQPHLYVVMAAVASAWAIESLAKVKVTFKWPNDLMVDGKKIGGILTEVQKTKDGFTPLIGIGININTMSFPKDIVKIPATSLKISGKEEVDIKKARRTLVAKLKSAKRRNFNFLFDEWKQRNNDLGKQVKLTIGDKVYEGTVGGWGSEAELLLKDKDDKIKRFSAGEIEYIG